ncbi:MAG: porphobilinogen synthase, partial [Leptospira sp.]|nr:porphobilinogen synthase [Leptospira sp.]
MIGSNIIREKNLRDLTRIRSSGALRDLVAGTGFTHRKLIQPIFVGEKQSGKIPMESLPGVSRDSEDSVLMQVESDMKNGVSHFLLFLVPHEKSDHSIPEKFYNSSIGKIKKRFPESFLWVDTCLCSLTSHGHCGLFDQNERIDNSASIRRLSEIALAYARSGADGIAPSDMMDGRVKSHREILDSNGFLHIPIMSYSTKFKSNFYGP